MDSFQGSIPPNFIPFSLDKQSTVNELTPEPGPSDSPTPSKVCSPPPFPPINITSTGPSIQKSTDPTPVPPLRSPASADSDTDITLFAEEVVQLMEWDPSLKRVWKILFRVREYRLIWTTKPSLWGCQGSNALARRNPVKCKSDSPRGCLAGSWLIADSASWNV